jgi:hypothetical protein
VGILPALVLVGAAERQLSQIRIRSDRPGTTAPESTQREGPIWWFVGEKAKGLIDCNRDYPPSYAIPNALLPIEMSCVEAILALTV